jgi:arylsulfatase A-like enzyme
MKLKALLSVLCLATVCRAEPRVLLISIDGCRPDTALRADMPNFRSLLANGSFTMWATTTPAAITLPSHTSMVTGVTIERHGISGNDDEAAASQTLKAPTLFDLAHEAGLTTGIAAGKSKFSLLSKSADHSWLPAKSKTLDKDVADNAVRIITRFKPRLMMVHFPQNDGIGHSIGWGTREQIANLANTDAQLGRVLAALDEAGVRGETTIILSADHGGAAKRHGGPDPRSQSIPWVIVGPGVLKNVDLAQYKDLNVRTYDTFATACHVLGLTPPEGIDGRVVTAAFEKSDLLVTGPTTLTAPPPTTQPVLPPATQVVEERIVPKLGEQPTTQPVPQ